MAALLRLRIVRDLGIAVIVVFGVGSIAMLVAHVSPIDGFSALFDGAFGTTSEFAETLVSATALLFPALGIALAFRAGLFNIGAEGQLVLGGLAAGVAGVWVAGPPVVSIVVTLLAGALAGGVWGGIAGWLKARFGANEVIATLMLNVIAALLATYAVNGPFHFPTANEGETPLLAKTAWLPTIVPDTRLTISIVIALLLAFALRFVFNRTIFGFELRAAGEAPEAARRSGVDLSRIALLAMTFSGAIAGLGGATLVTGVLHRFNTGLSPGYGFVAIAVALVGNLEPVWIAVAAFAFGILQNGALSMQAEANVPRDIINVVEGLVIIALAGRRYVA
ncbi:MAG TPA: ABC transporter permease, partial [Candidatus Lustribacter sp.]|nr:ABC transporter permease [Candidatus Lustribacter sp.]